MKLSKLVPYVVTKGNTDGSIAKGDIVWLGRDKSITIAGDNGGWIPKEEQIDPIMDFEAEESTEYILHVRRGSEILVKK